MQNGVPVFRYNYMLFSARKTSYFTFVSAKGDKYQTTCGNPRCIHPDHLSILNTKHFHLADLARQGTGYQQRKTHCPQGHALTYDNIVQAKTSKYPKGYRRCLICYRQQQLAYVHKKRGKIPL